MADTPCPDRGAIITCLDPDAQNPTAIVRGVVVGPHVVDPHTSHTWVPVMLPDRTVSVLDTVNIIKMRPGH
jgi:hypothetical protein